MSADRMERCRSCGEWTSREAGAHVHIEDGLVCPSCMDLEPETMGR